MKRFALALAAMAFAAPLSAQDVSPSWDGYYVGLELSNIQDGALVTDLGIVTFRTEIEGLQYGITGGYRRSFGQLVVGGEYDYSGARTNLVGLGGSTRLSTHRGGIEVGYAVGRFLPYATAGLAYIRFNGEGGTFTNTGSFAGVGLDYQVQEFSTLGIEFNTHNFGDLDGGLVFPISPELSTIGISYTIGF